jgi:hypothetical protein
MRIESEDTGAQCCRFPLLFAAPVYDWILDAAGVFLNHAIEWIAR